MKKLYFILVLTLLAGKVALAQNDSSEWVYFQNETTGNIHAYLGDEPDNQVVFTHGIHPACDGSTVTQWSIAYDNTNSDLVPYMLDALQGDNVPEFMPLELGQFLQQYSHLHTNVFCTYLPVINN